jgi:hypothetical protein
VVPGRQEAYIGNSKLSSAGALATSMPNPAPSLSEMEWGDVSRAALKERLMLGAPT